MYGLFLGQKRSEKKSGHYDSHHPHWWNGRTPSTCKDESSQNTSQKGVDKNSKKT